nr:zinc finger BED domain-containing protein RICESLEEPER 2 [Tanacetum cinerariifolium]
MFLVLSRMAMDLISVQASSVAFEFAFSTSGRVLSIRRTRLTPASLERCMCLKDHLDAKEHKQDKCPLYIPLDFQEDVFDDKVQRNEAIPLSDEEISLDATSKGTLSPRGPRCMCLKDHLDAKEHKQDKCPLYIPLDFQEDVFDDKVQRNEAIPLSDEEISLDATSKGTLSPRGPRYDYMMSSEAEDDY